MARRFPAARWLLLFAVAAAPPSLAQTVPAKTQAPTEVAVLAVGTDARSELEAARVTRALQQGLRAAGRFSPVDWDVALDPSAHRQRNVHLDEAQVAFKEGLDAYNDLETEKALQWLDRALKSYESVDLSRHWPEYVRAWVLKAACHVANGDEDKAKQELSHLVAVEPQVELPTSYFPKDILSFADKVRAGARKGSLQLDSVPPGAELHVDGKFRGFAPLQIKELAAAPHVITFKLPGYTLEQFRARDGKHQPTLKPAEMNAELTRSRAALQKSQGEAREDAARSLARLVGAQQVVIALLRKSTTGDRLEFDLLRIDVANGQTLARASGTVPLDSGMEAALEPSAALISQDTPRSASGAPVSSAPPSAGFAWTQRHTGYALLGAGAAAIAVGTFFTAQAFSTHSQFRALPMADPRSAQLRTAGKTFALTADVTVIAGVVLAGAGTWFAFIAQDAPKPAVDELPMPPPPPPAKKKKAPEDDDLKNH